MSAYRRQLADARADIGIRNVSGACADSAEFVYQVNSVTESLMKRGAWWGSEVVMRICIFGCEIVWPNYVGTVMGIRTCGGQIDVRNGWYAIMGPSWCYNNWGGTEWGYANWNGTGYGGPINATAFDSNTSPVQSQITGNTGKLLQYSIVKPQDYGKTITIFGKQYGGQPLQELDANGDWINGLTITAAYPVAQTTVLVTKIDQVTREATQGMTYLLEYDPATGLRRMLSAYAPNETNPQYRKSTIRNWTALPFETDSNGNRMNTIEAMVKLEFIPVVNDRDFLLIDDFQALKSGIQAYKLDEQGDQAGAAGKWAQAISELNFESRNKNPGNEFVTQVRVMGSNRTVSNPI